MAKWRKVLQKLIAIGYTKGVMSKHRTIYNCPCPNHEHPVGVETNHLCDEAYPYDYKRKLGPHLKDFGKV